MTKVSILLPCYLRPASTREAVESVFAQDMNGIELLFYESQICSKILQTLTCEGIPCLSIHDSFIVPAEYEDNYSQSAISTSFIIIDNSQLSSVCLHLKYSYV